MNWVPLSKDAVSVGDFVSTDAGGMPIYRVVKLAGGQAWLQGERRLAPPVGRRFGLEDYAAALEYALTGTGLGKTVVVVD